MKRGQFLFSLFCLLGMGFVHADSLRVGHALPDVKLVKDGVLVGLKDQVKGKSLVHVFASW